ncbi:CdaR family transcriptional regulator [Scopulibacillus darangshiensis]|uniref:CdaR family transcriptional regulator n=1 Tax=Scopulibacillus darangshiensis TaxID=442528 RepID=A0A4R2P8L8_9BACL|nr:sugar diacid recognition domain-containing protein [Scopulibacillus darangshiensis]TCP31313.1 CdaR family transcriptional regulator [Scopulibacillus darangshiensis]
MRILEYIAQDIADKTHAILGCPISITDKEGYIIGSTDRSRLGIFHRPSLEVLKKNKMVNCKLQEGNDILPGVSVPLLFNNKPIGVVGIVGDPQEMSKYVQLVKSQVEMMCQEAFKTEMLELESKMIEVMVKQIIHCKQGETTDHILQYAKLLDYNLESEYTCMLIDIECLFIQEDKATGNKEKLPQQHLQRDVVDFMNLIFRDSKDDIISLINPDRFIVIKAKTSEKNQSSFIRSLKAKQQKFNGFLASKHHFSSAISVGDTKKGISGISESYHNAAKAMKAGKKSGQVPRIFLYNDRDMTLKLLPMELITEGLKNKILNIVTPLIEQDQNHVLSSTFISYCKCNMNLSKTARTIHVHRNTIIYRLEKICELTALETSNFEHCMLLYTAIKYYDDMNS